MEELRPQTPEELASALAQCAARSRTIETGGGFTKMRMGGPAGAAEVRVSTSALRRVLQYEPRDLTISVEAGLPFEELERTLAENGQMVPIDPPDQPGATVGGLVAANVSGPRRRLYGTPRDLVIGMTFATLGGKLVQSGGLVVKNVAGLDMAKLLIGSFGTLATIAVVNFKLTPMPEQTRTFEYAYGSRAAAMERRDAILRSVLQPSALDLWKGDDWRLLVQCGGSAAVVERCARELAGAREHSGAEELALWAAVKRFPVDAPVAVRVSCKLEEVGAVLEALPGAALARAANGVVYGSFARWEDAREWMARSRWRSVLQQAPAACPAEEWWPRPGDDLAAMERIKRMFDPQHLLNRGRLHGRI